jgi:hypothetical protein
VKADALIVAIKMNDNCSNLWKHVGSDATMVLRLGSQSRILRFNLSTQKATVYVRYWIWLIMFRPFRTLAIAPKVEGVSLPCKNSLFTTANNTHDPCTKPPSLGLLTNQKTSRYRTREARGSQR